MAVITQAKAEAQLQLWLDASTALAANRSYTIGDRTLTRANAQEVRDMIDYWQGWVDRLAAGQRGRRVHKTAVQ